jgi:hypothetical protein
MSLGVPLPLCWTAFAIPYQLPALWGSNTDVMTSLYLSRRLKDLIPLTGAAAPTHHSPQVLLTNYHLYPNPLNNHLLMIFLSFRWLNTAEAFHLATQGGAEALCMGDVVGNFQAGKKLDCLVVDLSVEGSPVDVFEGDTLAMKFDKFIYLSDDRNITDIYVDGLSVLSRQA